MRKPNLGKNSGEYKFKGKKKKLIQEYGIQKGTHFKITPKKKASTMF